MRRCLWGNLAAAALFAAGPLAGCSQQAGDAPASASAVTASHTKTAVLSVTAGMT